MTKELFSVSDLIREFERGNFYHVNDVDEEKWLSRALCDAVLEALINYRKLAGPARLDFLDEIRCPKCQHISVSKYQSLCQGGGLDCGCNNCHYKWTDTKNV